MEEGYYQFENQAQTFTCIPQKHYPHRIMPKEWPSLELTGKAIARGWATPCRYYPIPRRRGGYYRTFVWPGISDTELYFIRTIMRGEHRC